MSETKTAKRLTGGIIAIIVLAVCLCITTFALVYASVSVENNLFHTGEVKINLNDGKPVIQEHEFIFEPGMTVKKDFFIKNDSTWDVYYRIYLDSVSGGLADVLTEFACWMPSNLVSKLCAVGAAPLAEGFGSLGAALPGGGFTQVIVAPLLWLAAASALILTICRKRDV